MTGAEVQSNFEICSLCVMYCLLDLLRSSSSRTSSESSEDSSVGAGSRSVSESTSSSEVIVLSSDSDESLTPVAPRVANEVVVAKPGPSKASSYRRRRFDPTVGTIKPWLFRIMRDVHRPIIVWMTAMNWNDVGTTESDKTRLWYSYEFGGCCPKKAQINPTSAVMTTVIEIPEFPVRNLGDHVLLDQERVISDFIQVLNAITLTIEAQLLLIRLGEIPKHPVVSHMTMSLDSFKLLDKYRNSFSITTYRTLADEERAYIKYVGYGIATLVNNVVTIWTKNIGSPFERI
uniref:DDE_Tnp_1_7 domain-containing protein n=1 Tax=Strongyloides papillosus TaxID=174720 RepID=A0A0N5BZE7_STREA